MQLYNAFLQLLILVLAASEHKGLSRIKGTLRLGGKIKMHYFSILLSLAFPLGIIYVIERLFFGRKKRFSRWLGKELPLWQDKNIISSEQADAILHFYGIKKGDLKKKMDMVKIVSLVGSVFVGLGIIFFIASNWQRVSSNLKTVILLGTTFITLYLGYFFSYEKEGWINLGKSLVLLTTLFWGASIALICQIYHIPSSENWYIMLLWAFPILPVAIFFENDYVYLLSSVLFIIWNFLYSYNNNLANYYYPLIIFGLLLPMAKSSIIGRRINILGLLASSMYCIYYKYEWLALIISIGLFLYYIIKKEEKFYLYSASISFVFWAFTYLNIRTKQPNFYFLVPLGVMFYLTYKDKLKESIVLCVGNLIIWINLTLYSFSQILNYKINTFDSVLLHSFIGLVLYSTGILSQNKEVEFAKVYKLLGFLITFVCVYFLSFKGIFQKLDQNLLYFYICLFLAVMAAILILGIYDFIKGYFKNKANRLELTAVMMVFIANLLFLFSAKTVVINTMLANILLISFAIISIALGVELQKPSIFNMGIAIFVLFIITRYIDITWELSEKSLFFIIGGLIMLIGGSFLEKQRRKIIQRMKSE